MRASYDRPRALALAALLLTLAAAPPMGAAVERAVVRVEGMACPFCAYGIEKRLRTVDGVGSVSVDLEAAEATLTAAEDHSLALGEIPEAVRSAGFTPGTIEATVRGRADLGDPDRPRLRVSGTDQELLLVNLTTEQRSRIEALAGQELSVRGLVHVHEDEPPGVELISLEPVAADGENAPDSPGTGTAGTGTAGGQR